MNSNFKKSTWVLILISVIIFISEVFGFFNGISDIGQDKTAYIGILFGIFYMFLSISITKFKKWSYYVVMASSLLGILVLFVELIPLIKVYDMCSSVYENSLDGLYFFEICDDMKLSLIQFSFVFILSTLIMIYFYKKRSLFDK